MTLRLGMLRDWLRGSLGARIVALFLGLLLAVQVASFGAIGASLERHARSTLPGQLQVGERVLHSLLDQQAQRLTEGARLLAADYGFRSAVQSNDTETIVSVLENHGARIGAAETVLLGTDFGLRAASGGVQRNFQAQAMRLAARAGGPAGAASEIDVLDGVPHQIVLVPMKAPVLVGWVLMGFPLDARLAADMKSLAALNFTLLARADASRPWSTIASSLSNDLATAMGREDWSAAAAPTEAMRSVRFSGEEIGVRGLSLTPPPAADEPADRQQAVVALLSLSVDDAVRPPKDLQTALLVITLLGFGIFSVGSLLMARRVTTPLRRLAAAAERLGAGDYETPVTGQTRHDEVGNLAQAFEQMRVSVGEKQAQILKLAYWDPLTGLPNRVQFRDAVRDAMAQAAGTTDASVAVLMLDLDRFKHVNDVLGYQFGDLLLKRVAERLTREIVRDGDMVARLGGDEFAVLLRHGDAALAESVAQRITRAFDDPLTLEEHTVDMGAGIGIACTPQHGSDADTLLSRAEVAMYAAKRRTAGPLLYDPSFDAASTQTLSLLTELRQAVEQGELRLYLQPKLALDRGGVAGAETLVRWQHPQRGLVPPMQFIPFAEQTGFIRVLTLWVFEEAARQWLLLQSQGMAVPLSVNLSTRDLLDQDLPLKFDALLTKHRVPAEAFCLEITESAIMDDPQRALGTLNRLSALGFHLSIDDFGTGYSSLAYLKRLPVDELKIDKSFVMGMEHDADDAKIVRSTIDLAHNMGLTVVAEGVENAKVWELLRELRCDVAQGYHMGRPMPADDFVRWSLGWTARQTAGAATMPGSTEGTVRIH
jgi:diguanylate cyclase (GGDEF)-like protein